MNQLRKSYNYYNFKRKGVLILTITFMIISIISGCTSSKITKVRELIPANQYLSEKGLENPGTLQKISIAPVGIRVYRLHHLSVDVVIEGPAWPALSATNCLVSAVRLAPEDWIEIEKPNGKKLDFVPLYRATLHGHIAGASGYSIPLKDSLTRLLAQARIRTSTFEHIPAGLYRVRLLDKAAEEFLPSRTDYELDTQWHEFEIVAAEIRPASIADMQQIYVHPKLLDYARKVKKLEP